MRNYADGQLGASATPIFTGGQDKNYPSAGDVNAKLTLHNTSGSLTETVAITVSRQGGTARQIARVIIVPNGTAVIEGIPLGMGDTLNGSASDATTVDYLLGGSTGEFSIKSYDGSGNIQQNQGTGGNLSGSMTQSVGAPTAAAGSTYADAGALPAGTAGVYPVTASNGTKGVIINAADQVTGRRLFLGNETIGDAIIVYGPAGAVVNGQAANTGFTGVVGAGVDIVCLSGAGNTWLAK